MLKVNFSRFWEVILRPDTLFFIITLQALSPYVFWQFGLGRAIPSSSLNYITAGIWAVGCFSFWVGCFLVRRKINAEVQYELQPQKKRIEMLLWCMIALGFIQFALAARVYGTVPILSYLRGDNQIDVTEATELQDQSGVGQIAFLYITVDVIGALLLETAIVSLEEKKKVPVSFYCGLVAALVMGLINGKRMSMFRLFAFLTCGLFLYSRKNVQNVSVTVPFVKKPIFVFGAIALAISVLFLSFGPLAQLRNQSQESRSSSEEAILYQEGPILNMELQTLVAGTGPSRFNLLYPLQQMIPSKWIASSGLFDVERPPREDVTAPSGFYEFIQWSWGPLGIVLFSLAMGSLCMSFYTSSRLNIWSLLCYSQLFFSILLIHSFNEFLQAPVSVVPCILLWLLGKYTNTTRGAQRFDPSDGLANAQL